MGNSIGAKVVVHALASFPATNLSVLSSIIDPQVAKDQSLAVGDVVVAEQLLACRTDCWFCQNGMEHKCDRLIIYGQGVDGCMAEYMIYQKGSWIHKVPKELSPITAVLAEPLAVCVRAMERAELNSKDFVVISGCGTIGLGLAAAIQHFLSGNLNDYSRLSAIQTRHRRETREELSNF